MAGTFWYEFSILLGAALVGGVAILPYGLRLMKGSGKPLKISIPMALFLSFIQTAILSAVMVGVGLLAAHAIGLGAPYIEQALGGLAPATPMATMIWVALLLGVLSGAILLVADLFFLPYWPEKLVETARETTTWENFTASFYGGINEEFLMRLFGLSVLAWLLSRVWHTSLGTPTVAGLWIINFVMAVLFALGHLPALKKLVGEISHAMLVRTLLLNMVVGLICGWLYWTYGIEAAVIAHFSADIVYHVFGTFVLKRKLAK